MMRILDFLLLQIQFLYQMLWYFKRLFYEVALLVMFSVERCKEILHIGSDHLCPELGEKKIKIQSADIPLCSLWSGNLSSSLLNMLSSPNNLGIIVYENPTLLPVFGRCQSTTAEESWGFFGPARRFLKSLLSEDLWLIDSLWNWSPANCRLDACV